MRQLRSRVRFADEPRDETGIVRKSAEQNLQRDIVIQRKLPRQIDRAHPTLAELFAQLVAAEFAVEIFFFIVCNGAVAAGAAVAISIATSIAGCRLGWRQRDA